MKVEFLMERVEKLSDCETNETFEQLNVVWLVDIKGRADGTAAWEISVIHKDNAQGFQSYGWFCNEKILISGGGGCSSPWNISQYVFDAQVALANDVAQKLNNGELIK